MGLVEKAYLLFSNSQNLSEKDKLLSFLEDLKILEAKLWGVTLNNVHSDEEKIIEDTNHLIHILNNKKDTDIEKILSNKSFKDFRNDLEKLRKDFTYLKKQITKRDQLKNLISAYTIKLVTPENYSTLEKIFLLEKQLNDVLDKQDEDLSLFYIAFKKVRVLENSEKKIEVFKDSLKNLRNVLAGHLEHHELWEDERKGYSNISNILHSLIKTIKEN